MPFKCTRSLLKGGIDTQRYKNKEPNSEDKS